jgi:hypothetical protein
LEAAVACGSSGPGRRVRLRRTSCHVRGGYRKDHHVSALVAGMREAAGHLSGHLSGRQTAADTSMATHTSLVTCAGH